MNSFEKDPLRNLPLVTPPQTGKRRAAWWQITAAAIGAFAIIFVFLWGISNQRDETAGQPTAATQATPTSPQGDAQQASARQNPQQRSSNAPATSGQGSREQGEAEQKKNSEQPSNQQPTNAGQNALPTENSGQQLQPR